MSFLKDALIRRVFLIPLMMIVSGCGFHLRGLELSTSLIESVVVVAADRYGPFTSELQNRFKLQGVKLLAESTADYVVTISQEQFSRRPVSTTGQIGVAEYELRLRVVFSLDNNNGTQLISPISLTTERIYTFDSDSLVGSSEEEALLNSEMRQDLVTQLISRINAAVRARTTGSNNGAAQTTSS